MRISVMSDHCPIGKDLLSTLHEAASRIGSLDVQPALTLLKHWRQVWDESDLLFVVVPPTYQQCLRTIQDMSQRAGGTTPKHIVAVGPADGKLILRTMRAGAVDYIDQSDLESELVKVVLRVGEQTAPPNEPGRVIAVISPSGGSGASTMAANLAVSLAKDHQQAALLDLKLGAGVLDAMLDLKPRYTLTDLCRLLDGMELQMFEQMLERHSSGVHLLAAPTALADLEDVTPHGVLQALQFARMLFPYVVVDVDRSYQPEQIAALREADQILVVLRLDFTSLRNTQHTLKALEQLEVDPERIRLVVNRQGQPREMKREQAEQALGIKFFHLVPDDPKAINDSNNDGVPVVLGAASTKVSRSIAELSRNVDGWSRPKAHSPKAQNSKAQSSEQRGAGWWRVLPESWRAAWFEEDREAEVPVKTRSLALPPPNRLLLPHFQSVE